MRDIKLRAWDEGNEVMHNDFQYISSGDEVNGWIIFISDKFTLENHDTNPFRNPNPYFSQQLKKMQYTGLKDKNGKEIFEGDIINVTYYDDYGDEDYPQYVAEVKSITSGCLIEVRGCDYDYTSLYFIYDVMIDVSLEVIGNIYENKELL